MLSNNGRKHFFQMYKGQSLTYNIFWNTKQIPTDLKKLESCKACSLTTLELNKMKSCNRMISRKNRKISRKKCKDLENH